MGNYKFIKARFYWFIPLLLLYIIFILVFSSNTLQGDEGRYINCAKNLTNGYYASSNTSGLWNGPGYPLLLFPFILFNLPLLVAKIFNSFLLFGAVLYTYNNIIMYTKNK